MKQYVYLYNFYELKKKLKKNLIINLINNQFQYITKNIYKLEEQSVNEYLGVLYDDYTNCKEVSIFIDKIMNQNNLYFIVINSDGNMF